MKPSIACVRGARPCRPCGTGAVHTSLRSRTASLRPLQPSLTYLPSSRRCLRAAAGEDGEAGAVAEAEPGEDSEEASKPVDEETKYWQGGVPAGAASIDEDDNEADLEADEDEDLNPFFKVDEDDPEAGQDGEDRDVAGESYDSSDDEEEEEDEADDSDEQGWQEFEAELEENEAVVDMAPAAYADAAERVIEEVTPADASMFEEQDIRDEIEEIRDALMEDFEELVTEAQEDTEKELDIEGKGDEDDEEGAAEEADDDEDASESSEDSEDNGPELYLDDEDLDQPFSDDPEERIKQLRALMRRGTYDPGDKYNFTEEQLSEIQEEFGEDPEAEAVPGLLFEQPDTEGGEMSALGERNVDSEGWEDKVLSVRRLTLF